MSRFAAILILTLLATGASAELTAQSTLDDYLAIAFEHHPMLAAQRAETEAARARVEVGGSWPDPTFSYTRSLDREQTLGSPREQTFALTQMLPWPGKLSLRSEAAAHEAAASEQGWRWTRLDVAMRVAMAYYEYAYLSEAVAVTRENLHLLEYQESVVRAKYRTDDARYADLVKAQVELGVLEDRLRTLEDQRGPSAARLNQALGRDPAEPLPWPASLELPQLDLPDEAAVLAAVAAEHPGLLALEDRVRARSSMLSLARRERYPDLMVGVMNMSNSEMAMGGERDEWSAMLAFDLPLWRGKYRGMIDEARAMERAGEHDVVDARRRLLADAEDALFRLRDARRKIDLYGQSLLPKAEQALQATATAYQTADADFLDFLEAERTLLDFQLEHARARADWGQRVVEVLALMGRTPLDSGANPTGGPR